MCYILHVKIIEAVDIPKMDARGTDAFCVVKAEGEKHKTSIQVKNAHPHWCQAFHFKVHDPMNGILTIKMKDHDAHKDNKISFVQIPYNMFPLGQTTDQWIDMISCNPGFAGGKLHVYIHMAYGDQQPFRKGYEKVAMKDRYAKPLYMTQGCQQCGYVQNNGCYGQMQNGYVGGMQQGVVYVQPNYAGYNQQNYNTMPGYQQQSFNVVGNVNNQMQSYPQMQQGYNQSQQMPGYQQGYQQQNMYGMPPPGYNN